jgi:hypothetical protein
MTCSLEGMKNVRSKKSPIQVGMGDAVDCTKIGDKRVQIVQEDGAVMDIVLKDCKFISDFICSSVMHVNILCARRRNSMV